MPAPGTDTGTRGGLAESPTPLFQEKSNLRWGAGGRRGWAEAGGFGTQLSQLPHSRLAKSYRVQNSTRPRASDRGALSRNPGLDDGPSPCSGCVSWGAGWPGRGRDLSHQVGVRSELVRALIGCLERRVRVGRVEQPRPTEGSWALVICEATRGRVGTGRVVLPKGYSLPRY